MSAAQLAVLDGQPSPTTQTRVLTKGLVQGLAAVLAEIQNPTKDSENPHFRSKYADLAAVLNAVRPVVAKHKLAFTQTTYTVEGLTVLQTLLMSDDGGFVTCDYPVTPTKNDPQGIGSALTYARRYSLCAVLGVAAEDDDDGNHASRKVEEPRQQTRQQSARQQPATDDPKQKAATWLKGLAESKEIDEFLRSHAEANNCKRFELANEAAENDLTTLAEIMAYFQDGKAKEPAEPYSGPTVKEGEAQGALDA